MFSMPTGPEFNPQHRHSKEGRKKEGGIDPSEKQRGKNGVSNNKL
jgi:hypothetical protein